MHKIIFFRKAMNAFPSWNVVSVSIDELRTAKRWRRTDNGPVPSFLKELSHSTDEWVIIERGKRKACLTQYTLLWLLSKSGGREGCSSQSTARAPLRSAEG